MRQAIAFRAVVFPAPVAPIIMSDILFSIRSHRYAAMLSSIVSFSIKSIIVNGSFAEFSNGEGCSVGGCFLPKRYG